MKSKKTKKVKRRASPKTSRKTPIKKTATKAASKKKGAPSLKITDVEVVPVKKKLDDGDEMLAEFVVTFNGLLSVRGFSILRSSGDAQEALEAYISPPMGVDADGEAFEVIRFLDAEDPNQSSMWNHLMDQIAAAFAGTFGMVRDK